MPSRTCAPERGRRVALLLALVLLAACGPAQDETEETPAPGFLRRLEELGTRQIAVLDARKKVRDNPFFADTDVAAELQTLSARIDACTRGLQELARYSDEADAQELPDAERLRFKRGELDNLDQHIGRIEAIFVAFAEVRDARFELFQGAWSQVLYANQVLGRLIEAGIPVHEIQDRMRDLSTRMLDARRYWCQELANVLRGLEPDPQVLELALGSARAVAEEMEPVSAQLRLADTDHHRLVNGREALASRLAWSRATLAARLPDTDPVRVAAEAALAAIEPEIAAIEARVRAEEQRVMNTDLSELERRDALVREQTALLRRLNEIVLVEAQKRGWPLPD